MQRAVLSIVLILLMIAAASCGGAKEDVAEKTYPLHGTITGRQPADNSLVIHHDAVEGLMESMTMSFPVRGARIEDLPPNGTMVDATLHMAERSYWITDVRPAEAPAAEDASPQPPQ